MEMRKFRHPRKSDQSEPLPARHAIARRDRDRAFAHVAILAGPPVVVVDQHAVAALARRDVLRVRRPDRDVRHAVAHVDDAARRRGLHGDAGAHGGQRGNAEIGAAVPVVAHRPAGVILPARAGVAIDEVLDDAGLAQPAVDGQVEFELLRLRGQGGEERKNIAEAHASIMVKLKPSASYPWRPRTSRTAFTRSDSETANCARLRSSR